MSSERREQIALSGALLACAAIILAACGSSPTASSSSGNPTTVSFAVDSTDLGTQAFVAADQGFFAKHGIVPVIRVFSYGIDGVDAMLTGQVDTAFACDFATLTRLPSNHVTILATTDLGTGPFNELVVRSGINTGADLAGKTVGTALGTATQYTWQKYLESVNVPASSVHFVNYSTAFDMVTAMRAGRIDAAFVWGPAIAQALQIPGTKELIGDDKIPGASTICLMVGSTPFVQQNPKAIQGSLAALIDASTFIKTNPDQAAQDLATGIGATKQDGINYLKIEAYPVEWTAAEVQHLKDLATYELQAGVLKEPIDVTSFINTALLKAVAPANVQVS